MTSQPRSTLYAYFETGDIPTQGQFADLIDSPVMQVGTSAQTIQSPVSASARWEFRSDISVSGRVSAGSLNVTGTISAANINVTGTTSFANLTVPGTVSAGVLVLSSGFSVQGSSQANLSGNLVVSGVATFANGLTRVVNYSRDLSLASGSQTLTGAGFQPHGARVMMGQQGSNRYSISQTDGTTTACILYNVSGGTFSTSFGGNLIFVQDIASTQEYMGAFTAFTNDGLTINWTRVGTPTGTIQYSVEYTR